MSLPSSNDTDSGNPFHPDLLDVAAYYHWQDRQAFVQAVGVAKSQNIDWEDLSSWHEKEGMADQFYSFKAAVETP